MATTTEQATAALEAVNAMPAPTWHRLDVNDDVIAIAVPPAPSHAVAAELEGAATFGSHDAFDAAVASFQSTLDARRPAGDDPRAVVRAAHEEAEAGDLDVPALSAYQKKAVLEEVAGDVATAFETGMGAQAHVYLSRLAGERTVITAPAHETGAARIRLDGEPGYARAAAIDLVAEEGATLSLTIVYDTPSAGAGLIGSTLRVFAGASSHVNVTTIQIADDAWTVLDDEGLILGDGARVSVTHTVLGSGRSYTGLAADVRGDEAHIETATRYLGCNDEERSFNYSVKQRGRATDSSLDANGVLADRAKKTLRGTIDFVYGCKGSTGNERETVLLADDGVVNKTVPVILCDNDDVMGNHGATIGHVRPEQRFYLNCRGLSDDAAEKLFLVATLEAAYLANGDARIRAGIARLAAQRGIDASAFADDDER